MKHLTTDLSYLRYPLSPLSTHAIYYCATNEKQNLGTRKRTSCCFLFFLFHFLFRHRWCALISHQTVNDAREEKKFFWLFYICLWLRVFQVNILRQSHSHDRWVYRQDTHTQTLLWRKREADYWTWQIGKKHTSFVCIVNFCDNLPIPTEECQKDGLQIASCARKLCKPMAHSLSSSSSLLIPLIIISIYFNFI